MDVKQDKDTNLLHLPTSFVGVSGHFYIRQRRADGQGFIDRFTVWMSTDAYNRRNQIGLRFCDSVEALTDFDSGIKIYSESLTTTPPPYERDADESDYGLTPARHLWAARFASEKAAQRHAA